MRRSCLITCILAAVACGPAHAKEPTKPNLRFEWSYSLDFQNTLQLSIYNRGSKAACIPQVETERVEFDQNGDRVWPEAFVSRAALGWRGVNLISGFIVVPPKKRFSIFYDITEWPLRPGSTHAAIHFPVFDCAAFFASGAPRETELGSQFEFNAQPSKHSD